MIIPTAMATVKIAVTEAQTTTTKATSWTTVLRRPTSKTLIRMGTAAGSCS